MTPIRLQDFERIVVLTGAGVSVASGLRPYRGADGVWTEDPSRMQAATLSAFRTDPNVTWATFGPMREAIAAAQPNAAHLALAQAEQRLNPSATLTIITQNVDGLHQRAGSTRIIALHGDLLRTRCSSEDCTLSPFVDDAAPPKAPACPRCGEPLRPDVVLFEEPMPAREEWESKRALRDCDLFIAVGTSGTVSPASNFVRSARYVGAHTVFINLEPASHPDFVESHLGQAESVLPAYLGTST